MKKVIYGAEAREGLKRGLDTVANAVKVTMGAKGLPVAIDRPYTTPLVTKDGVSVAREIHLEDPLENMGANMIISAAEKTNDMAGDGSSTSTVLTQAIVEQGMQALSEGASFYEMKKGMEYAAEKVIEHLTENSVDIKGNYEKMIAIPTISANNDKEIGTLIAETFQKVGEHGFISVEESKTAKTYVETTKGLKFKTAPESQYFFQDTLKKVSEYKNSKVLLYIGRIQTEAEIENALQLSSKSHLLIICNEIDPLLLSRIITTRLQGGINVTVVQCPEFGIYREEAMEDIALVCGAKLFLQESDDDISKITSEDLGNVEKLNIDEENTSFINSATKDKVEQKVTLLLDKLKETEDAQETQDIKERIARLKGGVARIYVGGTSEMEMKEKKDRVIDAVHALTAAYKQGIIAGGGTALLTAAKQNTNTQKRNSSFKAGVNLIVKAIHAPINQILKNAGYSNEEIEGIKSGVKNKKGFDVLQEKHVDMMKAGIVDPLLVCTQALSNALSVATVFLSTEAVVLDVTNYATKEIKFADGI